MIQEIKRMFQVGDLVTAPERTNRLDASKTFEFAIIVEPGLNNFFGISKVYLQSTGSYGWFQNIELKLVHREEVINGS